MRRCEIRNDDNDENDNNNNLSISQKRMTWNDILIRPRLNISRLTDISSKYTMNSKIQSRYSPQRRELLYTTLDKDEFPWR